MPAGMAYGEAGRGSDLQYGGSRAPPAFRPSNGNGGLTPSGASSAGPSRDPAPKLLAGSRRGPHAGAQGPGQTSV
jgi:hypothetical protein